ncbi:MAG: hypothetical protein JW741_23340 [Sedimentisphaerales bacterium]|nr:hypothetical protein [Sedimentisphaerales bacterium]
MIARIAMRRIGVLAVLTALLGLTAVSGCRKQNEPESPPPAPTEMTEPNAQADAGSDLRILYAGHPGSEREGDFVRFLRQHFGTVETADLATFVESQSDGFDVTILDYDGDGFKAPHINISRQFSRPLVTVGVAGGLMCSQWGLKTGYL